MRSFAFVRFQVGHHAAISAKLQVSSNRTAAIESGEQAAARVTIREVPDKNIRKPQTHRGEKKKAD